jgi:hypothetical protein
VTKIAKEEAQGIRMLFNTIAADMEELRAQLEGQCDPTDVAMLFESIGRRSQVGSEWAKVSRRDFVPTGEVK